MGSSKWLNNDLVHSLTSPVVMQPTGVSGGSYIQKTVTASVHDTRLIEV